MAQAWLESGLLQGLARSHVGGRWEAVNGYVPSRRAVNDHGGAVSQVKLPSQLDLGLQVRRFLGRRGRSTQDSSTSSS